MIRNSTISGNSAGTNGGGIFLGTVTGTVALQNSTIINNVSGNTVVAAGNGGGGINASATAFTMSSSIVAGNTAPGITGGAADDIASTGTAVITADHSAIGKSPGAASNNYTAPANANLAIGATLRIGSLANNGGPTMTHLPASNSPLLDAGIWAGPGSVVSAFDQRGSARQDTLVDIGAVEAGHATYPTTTPPTGTVTENATTYTFTIAFTDHSGTGISVSSLQATNAIHVQGGPAAVDITAAYVAGSATTVGSVTTATFSITPPGGFWDSGDDGSYTYVILSGAGITNVTDNSGGPAAVVQDGIIGGFQVTIPITFTINDLGDTRPRRVGPAPAILVTRATSSPRRTPPRRPTSSSSRPDRAA